MGNQESTRIGAVMSRKHLTACAAGVMLTLPMVLQLWPDGLHRCWLTARGGLAILRDEPAKVSLTKTTVNFETAATRSMVRCRFAVGNQGGRRLMLVREGSSCECIGGDYQLAVGPGQIRTLGVAMDTTATDGSVEMTLKYRTNDPLNPVLMFTVLGTVDGDVASQTQSGSLLPIPSDEHPPRS